MANPEHLRILEQGVEAWNRWRSERPGIQPDFGYANLRGRRLENVNLGTTDLEQDENTPLDCADLRGTDLRATNLKGARLADANLYAADLREADLRGANLSYTYLVGANLSSSDLRGASLDGANLRRAVLKGANVAGATFGWTAVVNVDLCSVVGLSQVDHIGPSGVGADTIEITSSELAKNMAQVAAFKIFLRGAGLPDEYIDFFFSRIGHPIEFYSSFISYSHSERSFARRLYGDLQASSIRCWLDEHALKPGDRILDVVNDAIRVHDKILLCCSESSLNSWWVKDEIRKAQDRERKEGRLIIIPLNLDGHLFEWNDGLASDLTSRLAADFTGWEHDNAKFEEQFERVVRALRTDRGVG